MIKRIDRFYLVVLCLLSTLVFFSGCITVIDEGPVSPGTSTTEKAGQPVIESFIAKPDAVKAGESAQLSWIVSNATNVTITPVVGGVDINGMATVTPTETTTYKLTAENKSGSVEATVTVNINTEVSKPDLTVTDIFIMSNSVYFKVKNVGNAPSKGCKALLYVNDIVESDTYTDPVPAGEEKTIVFNKYTWKYAIEQDILYTPLHQFTQYVLKVCVDTENIIPEHDEANNCYLKILGMKYKYDFVENAHLAPWSNGTVRLTFPTAEGNLQGSVFTQEGMTLEDGRSHANILATYPQPAVNGYISGRFQDFYTDELKELRAKELTLREMVRFSASVGFKKTASPTAKARFIFSVLDLSGSSVYSADIIATNDGKLDNFDIDLGAFAKGKYSFLLRVESQGTPYGDLAVWVDPKLYQP